MPSLCFLGLTRRAFASFPNQLRSLFIVLSDDYPGLGVRPQRPKRPASPSAAPAAAQDRRGRFEEVSDEFAQE